MSKENLLQHPQFDSIADQYEQNLGLPKGLLRSVIYQESRGNLKAVSPMGAQGVAQFMPATAKAYAVDVNDPWDSLRGAAEYLGDNLKKYGSVEAALADYNGGPRAARAIQSGKEAPHPETRKYIPEIMGRLTPKTEQAVAALGAAGENAALQVAELRKAGFSEWITDALNKGASHDEIVQTLAPEAQARAQQARAASEQKGAFGRAGEQFTTGLGNIGRSVSRIGSMVTGDEEGLQRKLQEQQGIDSDLVNVADRASTSGAIGGFVGDNAAALVPVPGMAGAGLVSRLALQGAASGAMQGATTSRAEDLSGVAGDTAGAAALGATGGAVLGAVPKGLARAQQASRRITEPNDARFANVRAEELGRVSQTVGRELGLDTNVLDSAFVAKAGPQIGKRIEDSMSGVVGTIDEDALNALNKMRRRDGAHALNSTTLPVKQIDQLRQSVRSDLSSSATTGFKREVLQSLDDRLTQAMEKGFEAKPEKYKQFLEAKRQWDGFRVVRDVVAGTNDQPELLLDAGKWASAQKRGANRSRFVKGEAPFQGLTKRLQEAKGQSDVKHGPLGKAMNAVVNVAEVLPVSGALSRVLGVRDFVNRLGDPKIRAAFEQLDPVQQAQIMQGAKAA